MVERRTARREHKPVGAHARELGAEPLDDLVLLLRADLSTVGKARAEHVPLLARPVIAVLRAEHATQIDAVDEAVLVDRLRHGHGRRPGKAVEHLGKAEPRGFE